MSAAHRQLTCAACGAPITEDQRSDVEPLIDGMIRYVAVHAGHHTFPVRKMNRGVRRV